MFRKPPAEKGKIQAVLLSKHCKLSEIISKYCKLSELFSKYCKLSDKKKNNNTAISPTKNKPNNITTTNINSNINNVTSNQTSESRQRATSAPKSPTLAVPICALPASQRLNPLLKKHGIVQQEIFFIFMLTGAGWQSLRSREESRGQGWRRW